jgi:hypothetical protein
MRLFLLATALLVAWANAAFADCSQPAAIRFAAAAATATVASGDPTPSIECYRVTARANQELSVFLDDASGAGLEIFTPGWTATCDTASECHVSGDIMSEPGETEWTDTLPAAGVYLIVIDNPRGDEFRLTVELREAGGAHP